MMVSVRTQAAEEASAMALEFDPRQLEVIDLHIGRRIRMRRRLLGMNQTDLARRIGVTFQQVHKYETGQSTIAAGRLYAVAKALGVDCDYFYRDLSV